MFPQTMWVHLQGRITLTRMEQDYVNNFSLKKIFEFPIMSREVLDPWGAWNGGVCGENIQKTGLARAGGCKKQSNQGMIDGRYM